MNLKRGVASFFGAILLCPAQQPIQRLLPQGAKIIETADLTVSAGPRTLVLWMINPARHDRTHEQQYCGDAVYGSYWEGPTRLSLVDPSQQRIINTVEVRPDKDAVVADDSFSIPYWVDNSYYHVPSAAPQTQGKPRILDLRDLTGEGRNQQFPLFLYETCGVVSTSAFGYGQDEDRAVHYRICGGTVRHWSEQVFAMPPVKPGYWKFTWGPGHGLDDIVTEDFRFDPVRKCFVQKRAVRSYR